MKVILEIARRRAGESQSLIQRFAYETDDTTKSVATALIAINERSPLTDIDGIPAVPIRWECNCLQRKCGACAMIINGRPRLACDARLSELKESIRLEPLKKFPVVEDLVVDRRIMYDNLSALKIWLETTDIHNDGGEISYEASRCLQCGCCLEVCPNFAAGGSFVGMAGAVPMTRLLAQLPKTRRKEWARLYRERIFEGCGKSLACQSVCPAGIEADKLLVNSNAMAVWKQLLKRNKDN